MLTSALDADPQDLHPDARKFVAEVRRFGWMATHIYASETSPSFTYSTGLCANRGQPELIVCGLEMKLAHGLLHNAVDKAGQEELRPTGVPLPGYFENVDVFLFPTSAQKHADYLLRSVWFYDTAEFPCLQIVFPDNDGRFPWQRDVDPAFLRLQPDLTEAGWVRSLRH